LLGGFVLFTFLTTTFWPRGNAEAVISQVEPWQPLPTPTYWFIDGISLAAIPRAWRFSMPVGAENGAGTYNAQPFGSTQFHPLPHLGDDLNGMYGGSTDLGDPVNAIATGVVIWAGPAGEGWGNAVVMLHALPEPIQVGEGRSVHFVQSFYAHLLDYYVWPGEVIMRGHTIGNVGTAEGEYTAHLHLELRTFLHPHIGVAYREKAEAWLNPSEFIRSRLDPPKQALPAELLGQAWLLPFDNTHDAALPLWQ
ncbi:MAG: M23 family metallopeptidase, partial [Verrucomicrobiales bacterium]